MLEFPPQRFEKEEDLGVFFTNLGSIDREESKREKRNSFGSNKKEDGSFLFVQ